MQTETGCAAPEVWGRDSYKKAEIPLSPRLEGTTRMGPGLGETLSAIRYRNPLYRYVRGADCAETLQSLLAVLRRDVEVSNETDLLTIHRSGKHTLLF